MNCPEGKYSLSGSVGSHSCLNRRACTNDDYTFVFDKCDKSTQTRNKHYQWKNPVVCDVEHHESVYLPGSFNNLPCRGCSKG